MAHPGAAGKAEAACRGFAGSMGWKGFVRSANAAIREAEREAARRRRLHEKEEKRLAKLEAAASAEQQVRAWEAAKDEALSAHRQGVEPVDWAGARDRVVPAPPSRQTFFSERARRDLESYRPGVMDKLLGGEVKRRAALEKTLADALAREADDHRETMTRHEAETARIAAERDLAEGVLEGDPEAYVEALRYHEARFDDLGPLVHRIDFQFVQGRLVVQADVHPELDFLKATRTLLKSGAVSEKETPKTRYLEWYQEAVASCALGAAACALAILPVSAVIVNVRRDLLDTATGHLQEATILSVAVPRATLERLNLAKVDASDALSNFAHAMDFKKTTGFRRVAPVPPDAVAL